jgi:hypothetical protein
VAGAAPKGSAAAKEVKGQMAEWEEPNWGEPSGDEKRQEEETTAKEEVDHKGKKRKLPEEVATEDNGKKDARSWHETEDWRATKTCRFFRMGKCNKGEKCPFQHKEQQEKEGDWKCDQCGQHNFAWREVCWQCGQDKVQDDQETELEAEKERLEKEVQHWKDKAVKRGKERDSAEKKLQEGKADREKILGQAKVFKEEAKLERKKTKEMEEQLKEAKKEATCADEDATKAEEKEKQTAKELAEATTKMTKELAEAQKETEKWKAIRDTEAQMWKQLLDSKDEQIQELRSQRGR